MISKYSKQMQVNSNLVIFSLLNTNLNKEILYLNFRSPMEKF